MYYRMVEMISQKYQLLPEVLGHYDPGERGLSQFWFKQMTLPCHNWSISSVNTIWAAYILDILN